MNTLLQERFLTLADGRQVALLENPPAQGEQGDKPLLLALHGWLDNSASFVPLAPYLTYFHLVCVDLPGHGHSDHKNTPYVFVDWLDDLYQITQAAGWSRFVLLGHSLGALIASAYAGVFPEQVERLILLEGLGPLSQPDDAVPEQLRRAILNRSSLPGLCLHRRGGGGALQGGGHHPECGTPYLRAAAGSPGRALALAQRSPFAGSLPHAHERGAGPGPDPGHPLPGAVYRRRRGFCQPAGTVGRASCRLYTH